MWHTNTTDWSSSTDDTSPSTSTGAITSQPRLPHPSAASFHSSPIAHAKLGATPVEPLAAKFESLAVKSPEPPRPLSSSSPLPITPGRLDQASQTTATTAPKTPEGPIAASSEDAAPYTTPVRRQQDVEQEAKVLRSQLHQTQSAHKSLVGRLRQAETYIQQLEAEAEVHKAEAAAAADLADSLEEEVSVLHQRLKEITEENSELKTQVADMEMQMREQGSAPGAKKPGRLSEGHMLAASISDFRSLRASLTLKAGSLSAAEKDPTYGPALRVGGSLQQQIDLMQNAMREAAKLKEERNLLERKLKDLEVKSEQRNHTLVAQLRQLKMELKCEKDETSKLRRLLIQTQTEPSTSSSSASTPPALSPSKPSRQAGNRRTSGAAFVQEETAKATSELREELWRYAKDLEEANRRLVTEKMELEVSWLTASNHLSEVDKQLKAALASRDILQRALKKLEAAQQQQQQQQQSYSPGYSESPSSSMEALPPLTYSPLTPSLARGLRHTLTALGAAADAVQGHEDTGLRDQLTSGLAASVK